MAKKVSEEPATNTTVLAPCGVGTLVATIGAVREFKARGTLSTCVAHLSSRRLAFSGESKSSATDPERSESCPKVGQSSPATVATELSKRSRIANHGFKVCPLCKMNFLFLLARSKQISYAIKLVMLSSYNYITLLL